MVIERHCPLCGQQQAKILFRPKASPGPVSKCPYCNMVYIASVDDIHALIFDGPVTGGRIDSKILTSSNLDDIRDAWEFSHLPDKEAEWPALRENAIEALQRIELHSNGWGKEHTILDFGSGWGFFLAIAKERHWKTYGLEPLPACAVYARATFGLDIITDTLHEDLLPPNFFHVITSFQVFEHLPYPKRDIQILCKSLRPGGIILIEVPNFATWTVRLLKARHRHFVQDHLNFFSSGTLSTLLTNNGMKVVEQFQPVRHMSIRHLIKYWFSPRLPKPIIGAFQSLLQRTSLWDRTIGLNVGDIVSVIASRP